MYERPVGGARSNVSKHAGRWQCTGRSGKRIPRLSKKVDVRGSCVVKRRSVRKCPSLGLGNRLRGCLRGRGRYTDMVRARKKFGGESNSSVVNGLVKGLTNRFHLRRFWAVREKLGGELNYPV
eukprot:1511035-Pyramimonas_sp.AAC.1